MEATTAHKTRLGFILWDEGRKQIWLADRTAIDKARLSNIVNGLHPSNDEAVAIAEALGRKVDDVFPDLAVSA